MSILPGFDALGASDVAVQADEAREIVLNRGSEWRFEVSFSTTATVTLLPSKTPSDVLSGTAEIFGCELAPSQVYEFSGIKSAVYTHHGCTLSIKGTFESEYVSEESPMSEYLNLHFALENMRIDSFERMSQGNPQDSAGGPRVLVVGPDNAGKTTLIKTLAGLAARTGRSPMVVNLDPREGMLCLPGCVSAAVIGAGAILDVEDASGNGWGNSPVTGPSAVPVKMPLVYHYGSANPEERPDVFKPVATRLALAVTSRYEEDFYVRGAGIIVDTAGSVSMGKSGYDIIQHIVSEFSINVLLILGSERLHSDLSRRFAQLSTPEDPITILRLTKSGGCVDRDESYMRQVRQAQIRSYFFGNAKTPLSPHTQVVDADSLAVFRMDDTDAANDDHLLHGGAHDDDEHKNGTLSIFTRLTSPTVAMQNALLAIKHALPTDSAETLRDASVMGYLYVADVDESKKRTRILSPVGGRIPAKALVWGVWPEGVGDLVG